MRIGDRLYVYVYSLDEKVTQMYNAGGTNASAMRNQIGSGNTGSSYDLYTYLVDEDGNIDFPTVGKIFVQGKTTREVKHALEDELGKLLAEIPGYSTISVEVSIVNRSYSIIGAQSGRYMINKEKNLVLESVHPSPLSANRGGWFGQHQFSRCNEYLKQNGIEPIQW